MKKRQLTQRRDTPWPFLYTVTERGIVRNLPPVPRAVAEVDKKNAK